MNSNKIQWWGYQHINGSYQAKRYFGALDTDEALESPFCKIVVGPFWADGRDEALEIVKQKTNGEKYKNQNNEKA